MTPETEDTRLHRYARKHCGQGGQRPEDGKRKPGKLAALVLVIVIVPGCGPSNDEATKLNAIATPQPTPTPQPSPGWSLLPIVTTTDKDWAIHLATRTPRPSEAATEAPSEGGTPTQVPLASPDSSLVTRHSSLPLPLPHTIDWWDGTVIDSHMRTIDLGFRDDHIVVWRVKPTPTPAPPPPEATVEITP